MLRGLFRLETYAQGRLLISALENKALTEQEIKRVLDLCVEALHFGSFDQQSVRTLLRLVCQLPQHIRLVYLVLLRMKELHMVQIS